jgi:hypothetical protein
MPHLRDVRALTLDGAKAMAVAALEDGIAGGTA